MTEREKKTIKACNLFGEQRLYTFLLMDAETGIRIFHEFASVLALSYDTLKPYIESLIKKPSPKTVESDDTGETGETGDLAIVDIIRILPQVFNWATVKGLSVTMLSGTTVKIDEDEHTIGESGICEYAVGDPLDQYLTLFYAIIANYPKYMSFLGVALEGTDQEKKGQEKKN